MRECPACRTAVPEGSRFCPECGSPLHASSQIPTELAGRRLHPVDSSVPPTPHPSQVPLGIPSGSRFTAGQVLAGRYRIIGRLGGGGMGEVYRADDLTLDHPVALKFLPEGLTKDDDRMSRFLAEVRIARQISHANVCRVYDIAEAGGQRFISMEYVDGEDLSSLLRRIGRYPGEKGVEIARQICAGLAAAHERGVLHRDLKPANVMIDGRGKVRITDFGLASLAGQAQGVEIQAGTPAYMSPEQLRGSEVTQRSDIYALGLVLYELFTGRPAVTATSRAELLASHASSSVPTPSSWVQDIDPAAERIILRCLEPNPRDRPASALAVAAALPGGDPLAAALAAGETPSPEMVAAAGEEGALRPAVAWALLGGAVALTLLAVVADARWKITSQVPMPIPAEALAVRAREVIRALGHEAPITDTAYRFEIHGDYLRWIEKNDESPDRWKALASGRPPGMVFFYRQSPRPLLARLNFSVVDFDNPPQTLQGMARMVLDPEGRLLVFEAVPPRKVDADAPAGPPDWSVLFEEAGLEQASFTETRPLWTPAMASDARAAWEGSVPGRPDVPLRVEAAAFMGKPVSFLLLGPWEEPAPMESPSQSALEWLGENVALAIPTVGALVVGIILARRNIKAGRGDTRGALRVALGFFGLHTFVWALWASHVPDLSDEWTIIQADVGYNLFLAASLWLLYVGLEPYVRRWWPDVLITWSRIVRGRFRDPLVGRDTLLGGLFGGTVAAMGTLDEALAVWLGWPPPRPSGFEGIVLSGAGPAAANVVDHFVHALLIVMQGLFVLFLLRLLLKRAWIAAALFVLIFVLVADANPTYPSISWPVTALGFSLFVLVLVRYGLVAATVGTFIITLVLNTPSTTSLSAWHAQAMILPVVSVLALLAYGFHTALAGRPVFGTGGFLDE